MDTKDKIIKKLLEKDMILKAPANFTSSVMDALLLAEEKQKPVLITDTHWVMLSLFASVISSILVFYYFNIPIFDSISRYFMSSNFGISINTSSFIEGISNLLISIKTLFVSSPLVLPLLMGLTALIVIERIVTKSKYNANMFLSI